MRKPKLSLPAVLTILFLAFTLGFFLGRSGPAAQIQVRTTRDLTAMPTEAAAEDPEEPRPITFPISLNLADRDTLAALPGIGHTLAKRIVEYRDKHGFFSHPEELLNIEGIGENRLEQILDLIMIGGNQ